jgi:hypothetical protein
MAESNEENILTSVAKKIGKAAGKVAAVAVHTSEAEPAPGAGAAPVKESAPANVSNSVSGRLPKKNKSRLPRRQKKALRTATNKGM